MVAGYLGVCIWGHRELSHVLWSVTVTVSGR